MSVSNTTIDFIIVAMALGFMVYYTVANPWWRSNVGKAMFSLVASVFLIPFPKVLITILHTNSHDVFYVWAELACKFPVVIALLYVIVAMHVATKKGRAMLLEHTERRL